MYVPVGVLIAEYLTIPYVTYLSYSVDREVPEVHYPEGLRMSAISRSF